MAKINKAAHPSVCKNVEIGNLIHSGENIKWNNYFGKQIGIFLKSNTYTQIMTQPFHNLSREMKQYVLTKDYMQMLVTVLFANQLPLMGDWIHNFWYIHTIWIPLSNWKDLSLLHEATWMKLKIIVVTEENQNNNKKWPIFYDSIIFYDFIYTKCLKLQINLMWQKVDQWLSGDEVWETERRIDYTRLWENFRELWIYLLSLLWWFHECIHISTHQILHIKYVLFIVHQLCFDKV